MKHHLSTGRTGRAQGMWYVRCSCGWKVTDVPDRKLKATMAEHAQSVKKEVSGEKS